MLQDSDLPGDELLHMLTRALPSLERLRITQRKPGDKPTIRFQWLLPDNAFPMLRSISYQPFGSTLYPAIFLGDLDELLRRWPRLVHVGALHVCLSSKCLVEQARYEHVERAQSASAADGGMGQLTLNLDLDDEEAAWASMQLQALPFTFKDGGSGSGQRAANAWRSIGAHWVDIRRGTEGALTRLAALLQPALPPLPCTQKRMPWERLHLKYM